MEKRMELLLNEMIEGQKRVLLKAARQTLPRATEDDILQPYDFPELEGHPGFRYEEGVLHGFQAMQAALVAL